MLYDTDDEFYLSVYWLKHLKGGPIEEDIVHELMRKEVS